MLELFNISWDTPDGREILKDINLKFSDHGITVLTGANGGGKTSLLKILMDLESPKSGKILFDGVDITSLNTTERAKLGFSYAFQNPVRFKGITVRTLLETASRKTLSDIEITKILSKVGLCAKDYIDRDVDSSLSGGEIKRIEIASVLAKESKIALFDEPEAGIDIWSFSGLIEAFNALKSEGIPLIIVSHQERLMEIADRIIVIDSGRIKEDGSSTDVLKRLIPSACPFKSEGERL